MCSHIYKVLSLSMAFQTLLLLLISLSPCTSLCSLFLLCYSEKFSVPCFYPFSCYSTSSLLSFFWTSPISSLVTFLGTVTTSDYIIKSKNLKLGWAIKGRYKSFIFLACITPLNIFSSFKDLPDILAISLLFYFIFISFIFQYFH